MPRFEFKEGSSSKFWEADVSGSSLTTRWGRIGTEGRTQTQTFASPEQARREQEKLIAQKTKKGYTRSGGRGATKKTASGSRGPSREARVTPTKAARPDAARATRKKAARKKTRATALSADEQVARIAELCATVSSWLRENLPTKARKRYLRPGASAGTIARAERALGVQLPPAMRALYQEHDGCLAVGGYELLPLCRDRSVVSEWTELAGLREREWLELRSKPRGPVRDDWWNPAWIPLALDPAGNLLCVDLAPRAGGAPGQVIFWEHDDPERGVVARSLVDWLEQYAADLEAGAYAFSEEAGGLVPAAEAAACAQPPGGAPQGKMGHAKDVDLSDQPVTDADLASLKPSIESLNLTNTRITDAGLKHLAGLKKLRKIFLDGTRVTGKGLPHLAGLSSLVLLSLSGTKVNDAALAHLKGLRLECLTLDDARAVTDAGLKHVASIGTLVDLNLPPKATDAGVAHLLGLKALKQVLTSESKVTRAGVAKLRARGVSCF